MRTDPELAWGYWLRTGKNNGEPVFIDDRTSETWSTLRSALWNGRLGMPDYNREPPDDVLELIHAVLAATIRRSPSVDEQVEDLFHGCAAYQRMFHLWLGSTGLVNLEEYGHGAVSLTNEGHSVLLMLAATRPHDVRQNRPSAATIAMLSELGLGPEHPAARFDRLEQEAVKWDTAFLRREEAGKPAVILAHRGAGPVPVMQTVWSLAFETEAQRDRFYDWLCVRLDRWSAWGQLANQYEAEKLTHKLLGIMVAELESENAPILPKYNGLGGA